LFGVKKPVKRDKYSNTELNVDKLKEQSKWFSQGVFDVLQNKEEVKNIPAEESESEEEAKNNEEKAHRVLEQNFKKSKVKKMGDFDEEEIAEIVAIGKKLLRKKD
jgi:hypothetical protein